MACISNLISFLFLTTLFLSLQINARDSQFFSKVSSVNNNNVKETELVNNEKPVNNKPEQQPVFIPESENSYGLYGHESGQNPPTTTTTTTTYQPYKTTTTEEDTNKFSNNNFYNKDAYNTNQNQRLGETSYNNNNFYNKDAYGKPSELSETRFTKGGFNNNNNENKYFYNNNDASASNERFYFNNNNNEASNDRYTYKTNAVKNNYNGERQGLSDTRYMENGRYFYDVNSEKYNPSLYGDSSRGVNSENWSNNKGYFGNNNVNYQNQEEFEDEQEEFEP